MYVEIVGLHHVPTVDDEVTMAGYRCFEDVLRQRIYCYTNEYATFAAQPVPEGEISLRGILSYENVGNNSGRQWVVTPVAWNDVVVCSLSAHADIMP